MHSERLSIEEFPFSDMLVVFTKCNILGDGVYVLRRWALFSSDLESRQGVCCVTSSQVIIFSGQLCVNFSQSGDFGRRLVEKGSQFLRPPGVVLILLHGLLECINS